MTVRRFEIDVPPPFRLDLTVWALRRRAHNDVDRFEERRWHRVLVLAGRPYGVGVWQLQGAPQPRLVVEVSAGDSTPGRSVLDSARQVVTRCLGLDVDLAGFYRRAEEDPRLSGLAKRFYGMRPPLFPSVFEALVNAIACQQLSLTVGIHLLNRLCAGYGPPGPGRPDTAGFPRPERLAEIDPDELRPLGFSRAKARAICTLSRSVAGGQLDLEALGGEGDQDVRETLLAVVGVGRWSAEYAMLRGLGRLHVLPGDDVGARNNLRKRFGLSPSAGYDELTELSQLWSPYGGLVYFHLLLDALADAGEVAPSTGAE